MLNGIEIVSAFGFILSVMETKIPGKSSEYPTKYNNNKAIVRFPDR